MFGVVWQLDTILDVHARRSLLSAPLLAPSPYLTITSMDCCRSVRTIPEEGDLERALSNGKEQVKLMTTSPLPSRSSPTRCFKSPVGIQHAGAHLNTETVTADAAAKYLELLERARDGTGPHRSDLGWASFDKMVQEEIQAAKHHIETIHDPKRILETRRKDGGKKEFSEEEGAWVRGMRRSPPASSTHQAKSISGPFSHSSASSFSPYAFKRNDDWSRRGAEEDAGGQRGDDRHRECLWWTDQGQMLKRPAGDGKSGSDPWATAPLGEGCKAGGEIQSLIKPYGTGGAERLGSREQDVRGGRATVSFVEASHRKLVPLYSLGM